LTIIARRVYLAIVEIQEGALLVDPADADDAVVHTGLANPAAGRLPDASAVTAA